MNCRQCRRLLSPYLDGELDAFAADALQAHLRDCPRCQEALDRLARVVAQAAEAVAELPAPEGFSAATMERVRATTQAPTGAAGWVRRSRSGRGRG